MNRDLLIAIEEAELADERIRDLQDSICALNERQYTILILLDEFKKNIIEHEKLWRDIELRSDFKAQYSNREHARDAFYQYSGVRKR